MLAFHECFGCCCHCYDGCPKDPRGSSDNDCAEMRLNNVLCVGAKLKITNKQQSGRSLLSNTEVVSVATCVQAIGAVLRYTVHVEQWLLHEKEIIVVESQ
jgi:hypothetical protein